MKVQKGWSCVVFFLLHIPLSTHVGWTRRFQVVGPSSAVLVFVGEDVTLPASLSPVISAQRLEVRWFRDDFDSPVLLYQNHQINGDGGLYRCFVDSGPWNEEVHITLNVEVLGDQPSISIGSTEDQQTTLVCKADKWGTTPELTWRDMNGVDLTSESNVTEKQDSEGFLRISSFIPIKQEFNVFSCLMRSKVPKPDWHSGLTIYARVKLLESRLTTASPRKSTKKSTRRISTTLIGTVTTPRQTTEQTNGTQKLDAI